jgi:hypothetical protein
VDVTQKTSQLEARRLLGGFGVIRRISVFTDGKVLVWHEHGLDVVNIETKEVVPLSLPDLYDPDAPDRIPLEVRDPAVSPDGEHLAFSGVRRFKKTTPRAGEIIDATDSGSSDGPSYIYVCNLDGSGLRRVGPLQEVPVLAYVFPETKRSALELAREVLESDQAREVSAGSP